MIIFFSFLKFNISCIWDILLVTFLGTLQSLMWQLGNLLSYNHVHDTHFLFICASIHHLHKESICIYEGLTLLSHHARQQRNTNMAIIFPWHNILESIQCIQDKYKFCLLRISIQCSLMIQGPIKQSQNALWSLSFRYSLLLLLSSLIAL